MWRVALRDLFAKWKIYPHLAASVNLGACMADFGAVFIGLVHTLVMMEMQFLEQENNNKHEYKTFKGTLAGTISKFY